MLIISARRLWTLNSPDFDLVDYKMWAAIHQHIYQTKMQDFNGLQQRLLNARYSIHQYIISTYVNQWCAGLDACMINGYCHSSLCNTLLLLQAAYYTVCNANCPIRQTISPRLYHTEVHHSSSCRSSP